MTSTGGWPVWQATFLPYGEEYNPQPMVNHFKFSGKERDAESGLDYFGARYLSSSMGRFISPDPLFSSGRLENPQSWNRYSYVMNNPLNNVDSTGLYDWAVNAGGNKSDDQLKADSNNKSLSRNERRAAKSALSFRDKIRNAMGRANSIANSSNNSSDKAIMNSYGTENDHNGVIVGQESGRTGHGATTTLEDDDTITINFGDHLKGDELVAVIAHEGQHGLDASMWMEGGEGSFNDLNHQQREQKGWEAGARFAQAMGMKSYGVHGGDNDHQVWNKGWKQADIQTKTSRGISLVLRDNYNLPSSEHGKYSEEHRLPW